MAKDHRLELDRYLDYGKDLFAKRKNLNFDELFSVKADSGVAPWTLNRFDSTDLLRRIQTKKLVQNPGLQKVGDEVGDIGLAEKRQIYHRDIGSRRGRFVSVREHRDYQ